ncbi:amino acid permease [Acetobacter thailandicus]|uniref:amino acid permease n=1 Tax=Acetobacter thailandicus TaxID=1502842 RepID=UPI001BA5C081|nr:amino acid permease [Acetobacter thailandicus]MBS1002964.1 amino acid permease [Acetobacter thailandicus]
MPDNNKNAVTTNTDGLQSRHIAMIALGGVIGAGLFVGSSAAISVTGPAVLVTFLAVGILVVLIMRMLGEMVAAHPGKGSFVAYIRASFGPRLGFTAGWLYWFFWIVVLGSEAIAGALIVQDWLQLPIWVLAIGLIIILKLINFAAPRVFGECEFWLSLIKVMSILLFIGIAALFVGHVFGPGVPAASNFLGHGGFFPFGPASVLAIVPTILFTMMGSEIATVAAAESHEPGQNVARVTRSIGARVTLFYLASVAMVLLVVPWQNIEPGKSPFVTAMDVMGIPGAGVIMRIIVLSAILSCMNSSMYVTSRILTELAASGDAPARLARTGKTETPRLAVVISSIAGTLVAFSSILAPDTIFAFLLSCSGGVILVVYSMIVAAYIRTRGRTEKTGDTANYTLLLFPYINYGTLIAVTLVFIAMLWGHNERMTAIASLGTSLACYALACLITRRTAQEQTVLSDKKTA